MGDGSKSGPISNFEEVDSYVDEHQLKELDTYLKCGICYEYFNTCVVTECSHNFCSLCIRKYLQFKTECPICFSELYDSQLRANRIVDNFVTILPQLKDRLIRRIRTLKTLKPDELYISPIKSTEQTTPVKTSIKKRRVLPPRNDDGSEDSIDTFIEPAEIKTPRINTNTPISSLQSKVVIPSMFQSPAKKTTPSTTRNNLGPTVPCPVCAVDIPEQNINMHLDVCLTRQKESPDKKEIKKINKRTHLPKLVLRLMTITKLRATAKEYGLNSHGDVDALKNRIQRYTVLYNAECDKIEPRPVSEIIRQLEKEEKVLASQKLPKSFFAKQENIASKEELNTQYLKENKSSFDQLVKFVRNRKPNEDNSSTSSTTTTSVKRTNSFVVDHHKPSTSKDTSPPSDTVDNINVEEIKVEYLEPVSTTDIGILNHYSEDDEDSALLFSASKKRFKLSRHLNFEEEEDSDEGLLKNVIPFDKVEMKDDDFDALTDDGKDLDNTTNARSSDDLSGSPVLQRRSRMKPKGEEESATVPGRKLRKRKR